MKGKENNDLRPDTYRDSSFLIISDLFVISIGIATQAILTRGLEQAAYGRWIIIIDLLRTIFLLSELGLPPLMLRELPNSRGIADRLMSRTFRIQIIAISCLLIPTYLIVALFILPEHNQTWKMASLILIGATAMIILSFSQRCGLRALGRADIEAFSKMVPAVIMVVGCIIVTTLVENKLIGFATVMLISTSVGLMIAMIGLRGLIKQTQLVESQDVPSVRTLLKWSTPFFIAVALSPLASRVDKFVLAGLGPNTLIDVAIYNIAQMAFLAAIIAPNSLRAALVPVISGLPVDDSSRRKEVLLAMKSSIWLIPIGIIVGIGIIHFALPLVFPPEYIHPDNQDIQGAVFVATSMLPAWGLAMLSAPWISEIQAGKNGWNFSILFGIALLVNTVGSLALVPLLGIMGAVCSTIMMHLGLLITSLIMASRYASNLPLGQIIPNIIAMCVLGGTFILNSIQAVSLPLWSGMILITSIALLIGGWRPFPPTEVLEVLMKKRRKRAFKEEI